MVGLKFGSNVTNVAPIAGPWLLIWTKITVGALKFRVRYILLSAFDVEIVKCAVNYLGACCADMKILRICRAVGPVAPRLTSRCSQLASMRSRLSSLAAILSPR